MFNWFRRKDLRSHLREIKKVKIRGVIFHIKKIDIMDHLEGSKVMLKMFQTYEDKRVGEKKEEALDKNIGKIKEHMGDVILAGTVKPKLSRKLESGKIEISELFNDWDMAEALYEAITDLTYGKKKAPRLALEP